MKKILVTGSNGFVGQKITERFLQARDFELIATSRGADRFAGGGGYRYFDLDLTDYAVVRKLLIGIKPDAIINTAAMALPDQCEREPAMCKALNTDAAAHLAALCAEFDIHLVHLSTDFIFDGSAGPYAEDDEPRPLSSYGRSKAAAEQAVAGSGARWAIVRTVLVYGCMRGIGRSNIVLWVKSSLEKGLPIKVVADQFRTPTLAEDLADGCVLIALNGAKGVFHLSGREQLSIVDLARRVASFWSLDSGLISPVLTADLNETARRPLVTGFIIDKAGRELGFNPRTIEEGLRLVDQQLNRIL